MCQYPLDEFVGKLRKFEGLSGTAASKATKLEATMFWAKKLKWSFCMKEEVNKLRAYIVVHMGSLNTQGLRVLALLDRIHHWQS